LSESKVNTLVVEEILEKLEILLDEMRAQQLGSTMTRFKIFDSIEIQDLIDFDSEIELLNQYILAPLLHKERYASLGVSLPKGVLLHGPPGCGKTSLAVAFASKAKKDGLISSALMLDSSQIVSKIVGKSENQLSEVFRECRKLSPCILIIDQIEMIAAARNISHSNSMDRTLSTLLIELDGVSADSEDSSVILICTTRNPNLLDPAILRPGRLDVHIQLSDISFQGRKNLLSRLSNGTLSDQFIETFAKQTDGFSAAEIRLLHRTACMNALRESTISPDTLLLESHWQHAINSFSNSS
jgi:SpoVK/Ycf46/Vps4 family AAA+-type ATPase